MTKNIKHLKKPHLVLICSNSFRTFLHSLFVCYFVVMVFYRFFFFLLTKFCCIAQAGVKLGMLMALPPGMGIAGMCCRRWPSFCILFVFWILTPGLMSSWPRLPPALHESSPTPESFPHCEVTFFWMSSFLPILALLFGSHGTLPLRPLVRLEFISIQDESRGSYLCLLHVTIRFP